MNKKKIIGIAEKLIRTAEKNGILTEDDVMIAVSEGNLTYEETDELYILLAQAEIVIREPDQDDYDEVIPESERGSGSKSALEQYLKDISVFKLLTAEEETELAERISKGDKKALTTMINSNLRLVVSIAKRYEGCGLELLDLIQEGNLGLRTACLKFDPARKCRFSSFATWHICSAILRAIAEKSQTIRVPVHIYNIILRIRKAENSLTQRYGRKPSEREIAEELGMTVETLRKNKDKDYSMISVDVPVGKSDKDETVFGDLIPDNSIMTPEEELEHAEDDSIDKLYKALDELDDDEKAVISLCFGFGDDKYLSFAQMSEILGLPVKTVRKLKASALKKLREKLEEKQRDARCEHSKKSALR